MSTWTQNEALTHSRQFVLSAGLVVLLSALFATIARAQTEVPGNWELIPTGIGVGGEFRLLLKTRNPHPATSTDIASYNAYVEEQVRTRGHAAISSYASSFKVLGSTRSTSARANTGTAGPGGVPIYWINGDRIADDYDDFYDGSWTNKAGARSITGLSIEGSNRRQILCTGTADDGTMTDLPLGGGDPDDNGVSECTGTTIDIATSTLGGTTRDVTDPSRYLCRACAGRTADRRPGPGDRRRRGHAHVQSMGRRCGPLCD